MTESERTRKRLIKHYGDYPMLQITDIFKYLFQSSFGCEHFLSSEKAAVDGIKREYADSAPRGNTLVEELDGEYSRVHLSCLNFGMSAETLGKVFCMSARKEEMGREALIKKLDVAVALAESGELPVDLSKLKSAVEEWKDQSFYAVRHSEIFRERYAPAYRVVLNEYAELLPLLVRIDQALKKGSAVIAIEGGSACGKTTLAEKLSRIYDCNVFHMDDFFLRPEQRTPERFAEAGGNVDRERFLSDVLTPLSEGRAVEYSRFNCSTQKLEATMTVEQKPLTIVEGAYSMHPELARFYDLSVFLDISAEYQRERILKRNTAFFAERFFGEWIPLELEYFSKLNVKESCDMVIKVDKKVVENDYE